MFSVNGRTNIYNWLTGTIESELSPQNCLDVICENGFAIASKPVFLIQPKAGSLYRGWYMLEFGIKAHEDHLFVKFSVDHGYGFSKGPAYDLPLKNNAVNKRLCFLEKRPVSIGITLTNQTRPLQISHLRMVRVTSNFAASRMSRKLVSRHPDFRNRAPRSLTSGLGFGRKRKERLRKLYDRYNECFTPIVVSEKNHYQSWRKKNETYDDSKIAKEISSWKRQPLISVLIPVYNTPERFLRECIESVMDQSYPNWELCIADDASTDAHVRTVIEEYAAKDHRIRFVLRKQNGHISKAGNSALKLVTGEYTALLDHDDKLARHALFEVVKTIQKHQKARIIYSDEDKINSQGERFEPHFKPAWNRDLFYSQNYVSHLGVYRTDLLRSVGGFRVGVEGSQDYDLLLRCLDCVRDEEIIHLPKILYHWRQAEGSTALEAEGKSYTTEAGIRALEEHLKGVGASVKVEKGAVPNTYRTYWPIPVSAPMVSVLIPTRDSYDLIRQCVESILKKTHYPNYEIIILNNQTKCPKAKSYLETKSRQKNIRVIDYDQPFNYSAINNFGVCYAKGEIIGLVNNDIEVISEGWLTEMVSHAIRKEIGCVGAKLYYSNDTIQHGGVILGIGGVAGHAHKHFDRNDYGYFTRLMLAQNMSAVTAACLVVRKTVYEKAGGLDEENLKVAFNDIDFCLRVQKAGYRNLWTPWAQLYHHESASRGAEDSPEKKARFQREVEFMKKCWGDLLTRDPAYSPHLTLEREDFSLS